MVDMQRESFRLMTLMSFEVLPLFSKTESVFVEVKSSGLGSGEGKVSRSR